MEITDVLGRTRPVDKVFPAGEWNCPFCMAAVDPVRPCVGYAGGCSHGAHCPNPACFANPHYPIERAREELKQAEQRRAEEVRRKQDHTWAMKRAEEDRAARAKHLDDIRAEAEKRGACVRCAVKHARLKNEPKFTKHRKPGSCTR